MPLQKFQFRPGINREVTSYTNEGGWYDCDKVRFVKGYPEKIGDRNSQLEGENRMMWAVGLLKRKE